MLMILTIELPNETIVTHHVEPTTTLKEIAEMVHVPSALFFCDRWKGELGTLMATIPNHDPIEKFNTNSIVVVDRNKILHKDIPRYHEAMTRGY